MKRTIFILLISLISFVSGIAQKEVNLVQLTGRLRDELLQPLPYANIFVLNSYRGTITDRSGKFSIVTEVHDSVMFSSLGYKKKILHIPDTLREPFLTVDLILDADTILLAQAVIYPWRSYEEFKEAFINLKLPEDDMERARKNIALLKTQIIMDNNPSARANYQNVLDQQYNETFTQGMVPSYQVLNPFAWIKFFEALKRGDFKKKN